MGKNILTLLTVVAVITLGFNTPTTSFASSDNHNKSTDSSVWIDDPVSVDQQTKELADELAKYFEKDKYGNIDFTADKETLMNLGISEKDADIMISIDANEIQFEESDQHLAGFVGVHLKLGTYTRSLAGVAAGAYAGAYVGVRLARLAALGPHGIAAAASITASVAFVVGSAVKNNLRQVDVGINVPFVSFSYNINLP